MDKTKITSPADGAADVAIIGGGWSGCAAAVTLADAGLRVALFEASDTLGGRARRVGVDTMTVDNGQHLLLGAYRETLKLIERVHHDRPSGPRAPPLYRRTPLELAGPGRFSLRARDLPAPWHMLSALATARDCSIGDRWSMLRAMGRWKGNGWKADPSMTVSQMLAAEPLLAVQRIWSPICLAALNTPIEQASAQVYLNVLCEAFASDRHAGDLVIPSVDLSTLFPDAAAALVERSGGAVHRGARVRSIDFAGSTMAIDAAGAVHRAAAVVIATAPWQAIALLAAHAAARDPVAKMRTYRYEPICTVYLRFADPIDIATPMLQLAGGPGQWLFVPAREDDLDQIVAVVISADGPYRALPRELLVQRVCAQIERNVRRWRPQAPIASQVIVERRATHAAVPMRDHPVAGAIGRGLYLAGDHTDDRFPATLEAACRSGIRAANAVIADAGGARAPAEH